MLKLSQGGNMLSTIGLIIDLIVILALIIFGFIGFKKGFINSVLSLFSWVVCIVVAVLVAKHVASWINGVYDFSALIGGKITSSLSNNEFFGLSLNAEQFAGDVNNVVSSIPEGTNGILKEIIKLVFTKTSVDMTSSETVGQVVGSSLGHIIIVIASAILVFIVLMVLIALLRKIFNKITEIKILGGLNKILGLIFGVVKAGIIILTFNAVLVALTLIPAVNNLVTPLIQDNTKVERVIYNKTDEFINSYVIEGEVIQDWISSLWEERKN